MNLQLGFVEGNTAKGMVSLKLHVYIQMLAVQEATVEKGAVIFV